MAETHGGKAVRATRQRDAVSEALERAEGFRTAQELYDDLRARDEKVGLTTVYRTLQLLVDSGAVDVLHTGEGEAVYRRCSGTDHHHHLVCRSCRAAIEIESPDVEAWTGRIARRHGFAATSHVVEIYGLCSTCTDR